MNKPITDPARLLGPPVLTFNGRDWPLDFAWARIIGIEDRFITNPNRSTAAEIQRLRGKP